MEVVLRQISGPQLLDSNVSASSSFKAHRVSWSLPCDLHLSRSDSLDLGSVRRIMSQM